MGRQVGTPRQEENVTTTPPETVGSVTVVTSQPKKQGDKPLIRVKGKTLNNQVVAWEKDELHPDGQAWVSGDGKEVEVYPTAYILRLIGEGSLQKV